MGSQQIIGLFILMLDFFVWVVIASSLLSFFLPPTHPVREALSRVVDPFLNPIRNLMPSAGGLDFSPLILILAIEFVTIFLRSL
ncbi:MAG: YggT family protein [Anaerolineae bacterium]|jgi:YggT family protein|nr:YggT family protein [Anaerolineae bacterium]